MTMTKPIIDYTEIDETMIYEFLNDNYPLEQNGEMWDSYLTVSYYGRKYLMTNAMRWFYDTFKDEVKFINVPGTFEGEDSARARFLAIKEQRGLN